MAQQLSLMSDLFRSSDLTPEERRVWSVLQYRTGAVNAITKERLSESVGMHERAVREAIKALVEVRRKPIGSTPSTPPGYFVIDHPDEARRVCKRYRGQALSLLRREAAIRRMSMDELLGQLTLDLRRESL